MKINVKFMDGNILSFSPSDIYIKDIRREISIIKDVDTSRIKLIFGGKILNDNQTFEECNIIDNNTLNCVISNRVANTVTDNDQTIHTDQLNETNSFSSTFDINPDIFNTFNSFYSQNNAQGNPPIQSFLTSLSENPELRNNIVNLALQRMNLSSNSPLRIFFENNLNNLAALDNDLLNQFNNYAQQNNMQNNDLSNNDLSNNDFSDNELPDLIPIDNNGIESYFNNIISSNYNNNYEDNGNVEDEDNDDYDDDDDDDDMFNELKSKYSEEFNEIKSMGFEDDKLILKTLLQCHGSVTITINKLCEE